MGTYFTDIQFYDENWQFICEDRREVEVTGDGGPCDTTVCQGDVWLRTQAEVDAFCGCEVIEGFLRIGEESIVTTTESDISDLSNLSSIRRVRGFVQIFKTQLTNLKGLGGLKQVSSLGIGANGQLTSLDGLRQLERVDLLLSFINNPKLQKLDGLERLNFIGQQIILIGNDQLNSIEILKNNTNTTLDRIQILRNNSLLNLEGLNNVTSIRTNKQGLLIIGDNAQLRDISALQQITFIEDGLTIDSNPNLLDCCPIAHLIDDDPNNGQVAGGININDNGFSCNSV